ncbi:MAG: hypothetical protein OXI73_00580 [Rhodospirillales bacterium]|nr:hypothetical protein [Rhodospirillales bacterium]MCY3856538.1 hypothetical protein [Rhodospirillales bacterium]MCY4003985.1 hypothetical protein [Rhodospirillales bacterium]MCY4096954.1 hypothetical protein [Rhodospirillales bacterium]MDE0371031.1 hypothetical protein [Rhodospirillales bacterium]
MATTGIESWAVDLKDIGAIYPFQGTEGLFVLAGVILWLGWHLLQMRAENEEYDGIVSQHGDDASVNEALEGD